MSFIDVEGSSGLKKNEAQKIVCASNESYNEFMKKKKLKEDYDNLFHMYETLNKRVEIVEKLLKEGLANADTD